jgi:DNA-directed RNA polymerase subunit F
LTEDYLTLAEIKEILKKEQGNRELNMEQKYALEHAEHFAKLSAKDSRKLVKELIKIEPVTEPQACKIADTMPKKPEEIKAIFIKERTGISDDAITKILDKVKEYQ